MSGLRLCNEYADRNPAIQVDTHGDDTLYHIDLDGICAHGEAGCSTWTCRTHQQQLFPNPGDDRTDSAEGFRIVHVVPGFQLCTLSISSISGPGIHLP